MPATCRHFNGIQNDACNLGIEYRNLVPANIVAWAKHIPCSVGRISAKELAPCEFLSPLIREEQEAETAELESRFKIILPIVHRFRSSACRSNSLCPSGADARFYYSAAPSGLPRGAGCEASQPDNRAALNVIAIFAANSCTNGLPFDFAELSIQSAAHCNASLWPNSHDEKTG